MKAATIIKNQTHYWIHSESKTTVGVWIASHPFIKAGLDESPEDLVGNLLIALNNSKHSVPHPADWKVSLKEFNKNLEMKSMKSFYEGAILCRVSMKENLLDFLPTKKLNTRGTFEFLPSLTVEVSRLEVADEIYNALSEAFSRCS